MNALTVIEPASNVEAYRASTDAAELCKEIVVASATTIQGRKYVCVEGWQAIAIAHGCTASARDVERVDGGVRAIGEIRRMVDGQVIATAEGFVGEDEPVWFGGRDGRGKTHVKRADYAIRAMAQTRAISRAGRSAFAHVVVMMKAGLATTPAEEVPLGGFDDAAPRHEPEARREQPREQPASDIITDDQRGMLMTLATAKGIDARRLCEVGGIDAVKNMPASMFDQCKRWIAKQPDKPVPAPVSNDILDDEVPY